MYNINIVTKLYIGTQVHISGRRKKRSLVKTYPNNFESEYYNLRVATVFSNIFLDVNFNASIGNVH